MLVVGIVSISGTFGYQLAAAAGWLCLSDPGKYRGTTKSVLCSLKPHDSGNSLHCVQGNSEWSPHFCVWL